MLKRVSILLSCVLILAACAAVRAAAIHDASAKGDLAKVKALVKSNPALVNAPDKDGATPLHHAAAKGRKSVAEFLLAHKANVNARKKDDVTPLHVAAALGQTDIAALLISHKADINAIDKLGRTPLSLAQSKGNTAVVDLLVHAAGPKTTSTPTAQNASNSAATGAQPNAGSKPSAGLPPPEGIQPPGSPPGSNPLPSPGAPPEPSAPDALPAPSAQGTAPVSAEITGIAREIAGKLSAGDFAGVVQRFDSALKAALPENKLRAAWQGAITKFGAFQSIGVIRMEQKQGFDVAHVTFQFQNAKADVQVAFNSAKQISGLFFLPQQ